MENTRNETEKFVREPHWSREEWLEARRSVPGSTGASEVAAIMGYGFKGVDELYDEAIGIRKPKDLSDNPSVRFGQMAEGPIRDLARLYCSQQYSRIDHYPFDILRMKDKPWQFATLDGEITTHDGRKGVLEIKTGEVWSRSRLGDWEQGVPTHYFIQGLRQLLVTGWDFVHFVAFIKVRNAMGDFPEIVWLNRVVYRADVLDDIKAVEEAGDYFHECVIKRQRPRTSIGQI